MISLREYKKTRDDMFNEESRQTVGGGLFLTPDETTANKILMNAKFKEIADGILEPGKFNPACHFFLSKSKIEDSLVFKIIKKMPKGAVLHVHDMALIGGDYIVKNITYRENLYVCKNSETNDIQFKFSAVKPSLDWQLMSDLRGAQENVDKFDEDLAKLFTLEVENPRTEYSDINDVWMKFRSIFERLISILTYKPVWEDYFYEALKQYRQDNILYIEVRTVLPTLHDLNGNIYSSEECARIYKNVNDRFKINYPDFFGARIIYAPLRTSDNVTKYIATLKTIKNDLGDFVAGFDLVGQEDLGRPLKDFIPELLTIPNDINVFYHAAETNWFGTDTDFNIVDAVLLNAKRLGHAYGLLKHPAVAKIVKKKQIAVEVNPLSNQILMLVEDLRNHPASIMLAENFPIIISSDDPGLWGALPLSHDMYAAFVGLASRESDIRLLKQLAMNSITFSSMDNHEKILATNVFNQQWNVFIIDMLGESTN